MDTQLYEIASLSHILMLKPDQYSQSMVNFFGDQVLDQLHSTILDQILDSNLQIDFQCFQKVNEIGQQLSHPVKSKRLDRVDAMWQMLDIARTQDYNAKRVLLGLASL